MHDNSQKWTSIIKPKYSVFNFDYKEIWQYRDLIFMFIKRDIVTMYKQTVLGPVWFFLNPILTTLVYIFVFGNIAQISTDSIPKTLFYLSGIVCWNYFSDTLTRNSQTFITNSQIFGKVYFPRIVVPISIVISNFVKFLIQFLLFFLVFLYYFFYGYPIYPNKLLFLIPVVLILIAAQGLGFGLIFSSLTTKYRDLVFLLVFGINLWQYATPIIYPVSSIPDKYLWIVNLNPMTSPLELFKIAFLGTSAVDWGNFSYSVCVTIFILFLGILMFNKVQRDFMDTI